jgi:hypothetical protein
MVKVLLGGLASKNQNFYLVLDNIYLGHQLVISDLNSVPLVIKSIFLTITLLDKILVLKASLTFTFNNQPQHILL